MAALIGAIVIITGAIQATDGILIALFPDETPTVEGFQGFDPAFTGPQDTEDGLRKLLGGILTIVVGAPVFVWHLNEARRREGDQPILGRNKS